MWTNLKSSWPFTQGAATFESKRSPCPLRTFWSDTGFIAAGKLFPFPTLADALEALQLRALVVLRGVATSWIASSLRQVDNRLVAAARKPGSSTVETP